MRRSPWIRTPLVALTASALLGLSACTGGGPDTGSAAGDETVTVWHYFTQDRQVQVLEDFKTSFEESHDGATVENVFVPYDQMNSKLLSAAGSGEGPDVAIFNGAETAPIALGGALAPLDEQWSSYEHADQFPESILHSVDDELYSVQGYVNLLGLWYNADILEEIGVEPPRTMQELEQAMDAAVDAGYGGITLTGLPNTQGEWQAYPFLSESGFDYESPEKSALTEALTRAEKWVAEGWLSQEAASWDQTVPFDEFTGGDQAFAVNGNWQSGAVAQDADFDYGVVPLPLGDSGRVYLGGEGIGVGAHADDPELAWEYVTSTHLSVDGSLAALESVGYLPARRDAAADEAVTSDEILAPFSTTVDEYGASYPSEEIPAERVADVQVAVAQAWSATIGGQKDAETAADDAFSTLKGLLE